MGLEEYFRNPNALIENNPRFFVVKQKTFLFDDSNPDNFWYLAFPHDRSIKCIRDLTQKHLSLLQEIDNFKVFVKKII